jgi:hypothetical protein
MQIDAQVSTARLTDRCTLGNAIQLDCIPCGTLRSNSFLPSGWIISLSPAEIRDQECPTRGVKAQIHLRTTNPIESTFATVRLRTKVTKGPGSRAARIAMAYKLIDAAQARWRAMNAPHLVALVRAGTVFHKGKLLERPVDITPPEPAESTETEVA